MAIFSRPNIRDIFAFKLLISLAIMYGLMSLLVHSVLHMKFIKPLAIDAPLHQFSEGRALQHLRVLSEDIDGRQVRFSSHFFFFFCGFTVEFCW